MQLLQIDLLRSGIDGVTVVIVFILIVAFIPQGLELSVEHHELAHEADVGVYASSLRPDEVNGFSVSHLLVEHEVGCCHCR